MAQIRASWKHNGILVYSVFAKANDSLWKIKAIECVSRIVAVASKIILKAATCDFNIVNNNRKCQIENFIRKIHANETLTTLFFMRLRWKLKIFFCENSKDLNWKKLALIEEKVHRNIHRCDFFMCCYHIFGSNFDISNIYFAENGRLRHSHKFIGAFSSLSLFSLVQVGVW